MGLMTLLTGKDRLTRQLEKLEKGINDNFFAIVSKNASGFNLSKGEHVVAASSGMSFAAAVNQFVTHYVRSQLDLHPKWTTEGNFRDEAQALVAFSAMHFRILWRSSLEFEKKVGFVGFVMATPDDAPDFTRLMMDMFKCIELERLAKVYPKETKYALEMMVKMHEDIYLKSVHDFPHEEYSSFLTMVSSVYFE